MNFNITMIILVFISLAGASEWTKCSKPCGTGEQSLISDLTVKRGCNFENCDVYDKWNLLQDGRMNDPAKWDKSPVSEITPDEKSYDQKGFIVSKRADPYHSILQAKLIYFIRFKIYGTRYGKFSLT